MNSIQPLRTKKNRQIKLQQVHYQQQNSCTLTVVFSEKSHKSFIKWPTEWIKRALKISIVAR